MTFRPLSSKETLPKCARCKAGNPHAVKRGPEQFEWLCAACEYREAFPDAPLIPTVPRERRPLPPQRETLFS